MNLTNKLTKRNVYIGLFATGNGKKSQTKAWFDWFDYEGK